MASLKELYESIIKEKKSWNYYSGFTDMPDWTTPEKAESFIRNYYKYAGKENLFESIEALTEKRLDWHLPRAQHMVSTFLLGILIAKSIGLDLQKRDDSHLNLAYELFVAILYHDIAYVVENDKSKLACYQKKILQKLEKKEYPDELFQPYGKDAVVCYFISRANEQKCIDVRPGLEPVNDHGIVGGLYLYDGLNDMFVNARKNKSEGNEEDFLSRVGRRCVHITSEHKNVYIKVANAVLIHNIYVNTLNSFQKKDQTHLIGLDRPLALILCLADTLEPIKYNEENGVTILDSICFNENNNKGFSITWDDSVINKMRKNNKFLKEDQLFKAWLNVEERWIYDNTLEISINGAEQELG